MSGYIIEEPQEIITVVNNTVIMEIDNDTINSYWVLYSDIQRKRFKKVLRQLKDTWFSVFNHISFIRNNSPSFSINDSNDIMLKIHRLFIIEHKNIINYYKDEQMRQRKQKGYIQKKINKLKSSKQKI